VILEKSSLLLLTWPPGHFTQIFSSES